MSGGRAVVIGGSISGLLCGLLLRSSGWTVDIFERSSGSFEDRGGGIVLRPEVLNALRLCGIRYGADLGVESGGRLHLSSSGAELGRSRVHQIMTSWTWIFGKLRQHYPDAHYHAGTELLRFEAMRRGVSARFKDGRTVEGDLLVGADGVRSAVRGQLLPSTGGAYAGYVAWRGLVDEKQLSSAAAASLAETYAFHNRPHSHFLSYMVPGSSDRTEVGYRRYNWVWYRRHSPDELAVLLTDTEGRRADTSIPPGGLSRSSETDLRDASKRDLPPQFTELVDKTHLPFLQAVLDLSVQRMAFDRTVITGDAAFVPRPHTAASTSKAATNAVELDRCLKKASSIEEALLEWQASQLALGHRMLLLGQELGRKFSAGTLGL